MRKKIISLLLVMVLSMTCVINAYCAEDENCDIEIISDDGISVCSTDVVSAVYAYVSKSGNYYYGKATMMSKSSGTFRIYLYKMNSSGGYYVVDSIATTFSSAYNVSLTDSYSLTSGTYKARSVVKATSGGVTETVGVFSSAVVVS